MAGRPRGYGWLMSVRACACPCAWGCGCGRAWASDTLFSSLLPFDRWLWPGSLTCSLCARLLALPICTSEERLPPFSPGVGTSLDSWKSQGVTSEEGCGVRGRELVGEAGREWWPLPMVLFKEFPRFLCPRSDCVSPVYGKLVSELCRPSAGKSSPNTFFSLL